MKITVGNTTIVSAKEAMYLPLSVIKTMAKEVGDTGTAPGFSSLSLPQPIRDYLREKDYPYQTRMRPANGGICVHVPAIVWMCYVNKYYPKLAVAVAADFWISSILRNVVLEQMATAPTLTDQVFSIHADAVNKVKALAETYLKDILKDIAADATHIIRRSSHVNHAFSPVEVSAVDELIAIMVKDISVGHSLKSASEHAVKYHEKYQRPILKAHREIKNLPERTGELVLKLSLRS